ncbi:hypothetical protein A3A46_00860 [Candidatus Roizmanbacteria bacterium RIFCSPLOWO2_01_FULL_37_13]|uniref:Glycosyltransferase RgtA/B/C/D-like domain-containing protein n=1 Tax=Candidatus Roizmanbacteria bacterium RIFCSPHIGHO2_02_FULL_38_11 TaxID=1802039 RepID=A0A1F7H2M0_9BACT|nr:MAG: hypothetical protein A3C25_02670 [Candidatus Roizmanbacteria bacterium RIFCSPHIGHO2_02_FULL_38_11]OGK33822.1 MAG: hypothetical protein A3F58_04345 [Candidatus Roizmanbacteria bacterium RIFCSPHIGHO2_12_FULL_37_9b]OGK41238.1 MAG: hypothetical protein A3A46_00860 [Candidatus Roizmanbacteria bacterium RIFCSPLOWO2_01_FULL_37_13]
MKRHLLLVCFSILLLTLIFATYKDYGVPWDEKVFFNTGKYYVVKLFNFLNISTNLSTGGFEPTFYHLKGHGVFMDVLTVFAGLPFSNFNFETLHLIRALYAIPIFLLLYWIVSKLLSKVYGLISIVFLLLFPRFYPEIFYNAVDIPTTLLFTIFLAYFIYYAQTKQTILKSILFGFILGITINQRLLLLYLPILNFIFLGIPVMLNSFQHLNSKARSRNKFGMTNWKSFLLNQFVIFNFSLLTMHLTHPYLLSHPITGLIDILKSAKQYPWNAAVLFDGQSYQAGVNPLPWYYLPKTMLITIPLIILFLFLIGNIRILFPIIKNQIVRKTSLTPEVRGIDVTLYSYILLIFFTPLVLTFLLKPTLYDSWRQFLFLTIPMIIIAMYGLDWIWSLRHSGKRLEGAHPESLFKKLRFWTSRNDKMMLIWKLVIGIWIFINLGFTAVTMINLHPLEYLYYNSLVGGLKGAFGKYETDYWGLSYKEAVLWFNKKVNDPKKQYQIFAEGDPLSSSYYFKPNTKLTLNVNEADYIFTFTRWNFHLRHPGKTIYTVEREGVPLIFVKKTLISF